MQIIIKRIFSLLIAFVLVLYMASAMLTAHGEDSNDDISSDSQTENGQTQTGSLGDVDQNGEVTVSDVVALRDIIMRGTSTAAELTSGDLDHNDQLTVSDVVALRNIIMEGPGAIDMVEINAANFPDDTFRADVEGFDLNGNGWLSVGEIASVTTINVDTNPVYVPENPPEPREKISTLKGIEYFTALQSLACGNNNLTELDVSHNTNITFLDCSNNALETLDISQNTKLTGLGCYSNQLNALDVSQNTALISLVCFDNRLSELDVSENSLLEDLYCKNNSLTELDLTRNTALKHVSCDDTVQVIGWNQ